MPPDRRASELLSCRTRNNFREAMVGALVLRGIDDAYQAEGFTPDPTPPLDVSGQRRTLVEQYHANIDFADRSQVLRVLRVFETLLPWMRETSPKGYVETARFLENDGFSIVNDHIVPTMGTSSLIDLRAVAESGGAGHIVTTIRRIEMSIDDDPALAIGSAKELVESCAKTILAERGETFDPKADVPQLVKATLKILALVPNAVPDAAKGADTMKRLLMNFATVVQGIAEMRNLYGSGHGRDGKWKGVGPRHARLAVNAAATLVVFLFETHAERPSEPSGGA